MIFVFQMNFKNSFHEMLIERYIHSLIHIILTHEASKKMRMYVYNKINIVSEFMNEKE